MKSLIQSLSLSYKHLDSNPQYPNPAILCDYRNCAVAQDTDQFVRQACCLLFTKNISFEITLTVQSLLRY